MHDLAPIARSIPSRSDWQQPLGPFNSLPASPQVICDLLLDPSSSHGSHQAAALALRNLATVPEHAAAIQAEGEGPIRQLVEILRAHEEQVLVLRRPSILTISPLGSQSQRLSCPSDPSPCPTLPSVEGRSPEPSAAPCPLSGLLRGRS